MKEKDLRIDCGCHVIYTKRCEKSFWTGSAVTIRRNRSARSLKDYLRELCLDGVLEKNPEEKRYAEYRLVG